MSIRDWPDDERPREKLLARGGDALSDAELLAVFIGSGRRGQSAVDLGRALLAGAGGLKTAARPRAQCRRHRRRRLVSAAWPRSNSAGAISTPK